MITEEEFLNAYEVKKPPKEALPFEGGAERIYKKAEHASPKPDDYYGRLSPQPIEYMHKAMTKEQFTGFCLGNILKYALRFGHKDATAKEARKIANYARWLAENEEGKDLTF